MGTLEAHSIMKRFTRVGLLILLAVMSASAQVDKKCSGRVYSSREVTKPARIIEGPKLNIGLFDPVARARFVLDAVLCRNGHVTDISVIEGISPEINKFAIAAISLVEFRPAELRWHSVSQWIRFELESGPNETRMQVRTSADSAARLVESVDIIGNRRLTTKEILSSIQTRPGDPYNEEKLKRDFAAILGSGQFDKTQTRVMIEDGVRGGVRVIFEVVELPIIGEINFENFKVERSVILAALKKEQIDLQPGKPYDVATVKRAARIIGLLLAEIGQTNSNVEIRIEQVSATKVNITFVITPTQ
jgi:hypothetical protein